MFANEFALTSRGRRRAARICLKPLVLAMSLAGVLGSAQAAPAVDALPTGLERQTGEIQFVYSKNAPTLDINQSSQNAVATAGTFSIGANARVNVNGPSASSNTMIRVTGGSPSEIYGALVANNHLWLVNASGIYVGAKGSISAASLLMSARDVSAGEVASGYASFMAGKPVPFLTGANSNDFGGGFIEIDPGATVTADGGLVMIAPNYIYNQGTIATNKPGELTLLVGNSAEVEIGDSGFITLAPLLPSVSDNSSQVGRALFNDSTGVIRSDDGQVRLIVAGSGGRGITFGGAQTGASGNDGITPVNGLLNTGTISAQTFNGTGNVLMQVIGSQGFAINQGTVTVNGLSEGSAGTIDIVAPNILNGSDNVESPAQLLADGSLGGGQINLVATGDTAKVISVGPNSLISANARDNGNGGSIRVLGAPNVNSDTQTSLDAGNPAAISLVTLQGTLRAQGGTGGGNGGQIIVSGTMVNSRDTSADTPPATFLVDVPSTNTTGKAGTWSLYSPQVLIGNIASLSDISLTSRVFDEDLNTLLNTGANVKIGTYADATTTRPYVEVLDGTHIQSGFAGAQELAIESVDSVYLGRLQNGSGAGFVIEATKGPMAVKLTADSDNNGVGDLAVVGQQQRVQLAVPGRSVAQITSVNQQAQIITLGGNITLTGRSVTTVTPGSVASPALGDAVTLDNALLNAQGGKVSISGTGGVGISGDASTPVNGVTMGNTQVIGGDITITGGSLAATGVKLNGVDLSTTTNGKIKVHGYSVGTAKDGFHVGVDALDVVADLGRAGELQMSGLAVGGAQSNAVGLRIGGLYVTTDSTAVDGAVPRVTLVGQSDLSSAPGLQVNNGLFVYNGASEGSRSNADVVIGAKANPSTAEQALDLGLSSGQASFDLQTSGHINVRPMQVSQKGELSEDPSTAIFIGQRPDVASFRTNFIVPSTLFNGGMGSGLNVIVGSSLHSGRITTGDQVFLDPSATATLQNQGPASGGIEIGAQGGQPIDQPAQAGRAQAQATDTTSAGILNLVSGGNVTQTGPIFAQAVNVVTSPQAAVTLNNPGNQIGSMLISGGSPVAITPGATPSATGSITVFDAGANQFRTINATSNGNGGTTTSPDIPIEDAIAPAISTVESSDALGELRTDVYVRGQFTRPQVCTPANTGGGVTADLDADPLAQQWLQVRRSAQLSSCSSVRTDSNCSAF